MAATYSTSLASDRDKVRFYTGDRDVTSALFSDEEIAAILVLYPDVVQASCELLESALTEYAHKPSTSTLGLSIGAERFAQLKDRLASLRRLTTSRAAVACPAVAGGRSLSERDALTSDSDLIQPGFTVNQHDNPGTDPTAYERNSEDYT